MSLMCMTQKSEWPAVGRRQHCTEEIIHYLARVQVPVQSLVQQRVNGQSQKGEEDADASLGRPVGLLIGPPQQRHPARHQTERKCDVQSVGRRVVAFRFGFRYVRLQNKTPCH